jgi:hypothetical protein
LNLTLLVYYMKEARTVPTGLEVAMEKLEQTFGVKLNQTYAYSPFSLSGMKAWRPVTVFGFDVTSIENPEVLYVEADSEGRHYKKIKLNEFKKTFKVVTAEPVTRGGLIALCG